MKILITGVTGFIGSYLAELLLKNGDEIHGIARWRSNRENLKKVISDIELHDADLLDQGSLIRVLSSVKPDQIYHLAAASYVLTSFNSPVNSMLVNAIGTMNLLEAMRTLKMYDTKFVGITSSEVYGDVDTKHIPITEECPLNPASPYGLSKVAQDLTILQYYINYGLQTVRIRNFTTTGPRRGDVFFLSSFTKQAAAIRLGIKKENEIKVGNLNSVRTVCDVRDMVLAYSKVMKNGKPGEAYNIAGKVTMTIGEYLQLLLDLHFPKNKKPAIVVSKDLLRKTDITLQIPDVSKFEKEINFGTWEPNVPIEETLRDMVSYWEMELIKNSWKEYTLEY